jgi:hypothetical protein
MLKKEYGFPIDVLKYLYFGFSCSLCLRKELSPEWVATYGECVKDLNKLFQNNMFGSAELAFWTRPEYKLLLWPDQARTIIRIIYKRAPVLPGENNSIMAGCYHYFRYASFEASQMTREITVMKEMYLSSKRDHFTTSQAQQQ